MANATTHHFSFGDRLVHPTKPEWGVGTVSKAAPDSHQGSPCQRLSIRFERAGMKTISTGVVTLQRADDPSAAAGPAAAPAAAVANAPGGWLDEASLTNPSEAMGKLPEAAIDPFATPVQRLESTVKLYRFSREPAALLDWASTQTGLADPLSRFSRAELEQFFERYEHNRDKHLRDLVHEVRRTDQAAADRVMSAAPPAARTALKRSR